MFDYVNDNFDTNTKFNCVCAYTLNGTQPVICSYVLDDPLYCLDEEE